MALRCGPRSIITACAVMTHANMLKEDRLKAGMVASRVLVHRAFLFCSFLIIYILVSFFLFFLSPFLFFFPSLSVALALSLNLLALRGNPNRVWRKDQMRSVKEGGLLVPTGPKCAWDVS